MVQVEFNLGCKQRTLLQARWRCRPGIHGAVYTALVLVGLNPSTVFAAWQMPQTAVLNSEISGVMKDASLKGLAIAIINEGQVRYVRCFGVRNARGEPLTPDTIMYGASLTKTVFAYAVMRLVDRGELNLDEPIASMLRQPLVDYPSEKGYPNWQDLKSDVRWRQITPRHVLTHSTGLPNYASLEEDGELHIHFDPGTRYAYSGSGFALLQFGLEKGVGLDIEAMTDSVFRRLDMTRTHLAWHSNFSSNYADGWNDKGQVEPHAKQEEVHVASSMDTTINDAAKFAAGLINCDGLSSASCTQMTGPQLHISSKHQFPTLRPDLQLPSGSQRSDLYAGLGVITFHGPQGSGFYKGGHDSSTGNMMLCVRSQQRCVVILSNDVRAEKEFDPLFRFILGETGVPLGWEFGNQAGRS